MRKLHYVILVLTLFVPVSQAQPLPCSVTNRENCAYVSTFTGSMIYRIDTSAGTASVINDGSGRPVPELPKAVVEGPDKLLYYADASTCGIRRFDPFAAKGADGLNSTLETILTEGPFCPAGLTFDADGNLFANTDPFAGVYKIVQQDTLLPVSKVPLGSFGSASALLVLNAGSTSSTGGAGIVFLNNGDLLFVGQTPDQALTSSALGKPPFSSAKPLITAGLQEPLGAVQDIADNIFVANHSSSKRNIVKCRSNGKNCDEFAIFSDPADSPVYLDANSEGELVAATEQIILGTHANGKIWLLTGPGPCPGINCTLAASIPVIGGQAAPAYGVTLGATSAIRSATFGPSHGNSQIFDFGTSFFRLKYQGGALTTHTVTVRAQEVYPVDLTFDSPATKCNSSHGKKGRCVAYELVGFIPTMDVDYEHGYSVYIRYSGQIPIQPAFLHDSRTLAEILAAGGPDFIDNIFDRFDLGPPGFDPGTGGKSTDQFTAYITADLGALGNKSITSFTPPVDSSQITDVKRGRTLPVKLSISDESGHAFRSATVRLGVAKISADSVFPDEVRSNVNSENLFRIERNVYLYNLETDDLPLGLNVLTAVTDKDSQFKIPPIIAVINVKP